ncbi:MAG: metal ABC transporter permease [bacterium]|nr:metal ABC transporter permease [bacterium]
MNLFLEPLQYPFFVRGLYATLFIGVLCSVVGTFVVVRGMAFFGDALAHSIMPGLAIGYLVGGSQRSSLFWWGIAAAIVSALGISSIQQKTKFSEDTAIGIVFAGMFALGIAIISSTPNYPVDLNHLLFGDVLGISKQDLIRTGIFSVLIVLIILIFFRIFVLISFDRTLALTLRLPLKFYDTLLLIFIAISIIVSLQTVGVAMMVAMLITPVATALLFTHRVMRVMIYGSFLACLSGIMGLYISHHINIASGASIVLTATILFFGGWLLKMVKK